TFDAGGSVSTIRSAATTGLGVQKGRGMVRLPSSIARCIGAAGFIWVAGACSTVDAPNSPDAQPSVPALPAELAPMLVRCQGDARTGSLSCGDHVASAPQLPTIVLGGQRIYVELISSNDSYDGGTGVFQADVAIHNLIDQKLGTANGTTATGVKV